MDLKIEDYMHMWKSHFEEQEKYIQEVRSVKHDIHAHLIVLQYYLEEGKYEEAKAYLQLMRSQEHTKSLERDIEIGNPLVNVILKEYLRKSETLIHFHCKGELPNETIVADYDWCTIFSNLMSNAVEACAKLQSLEKVIRLEISSNGCDLCIVMDNPVEWDVKHDLLEKGTTKEDKASHGFGLKNIRAVIQKYGGELEYICTESRFAVKIVLPKEHVE